MAPEKKGNGGQARSVLQAQEAFVSHRPTHDQIRHRAYQIYLERGARPGQELDDWLRADRELQRIALFTRDWNRLQQRRYGYLTGWTKALCQINENDAVGKSYYGVFHGRSSSA